MHPRSRQVLCRLHGHLRQHTLKGSSAHPLNQRRAMASDTAGLQQETSRIPDDPDILTTQAPGLNPSTHSKKSASNQDADALQNKSFPRLQYRPPPLGVVPAYDAALELIAEERAQTQRKLAATKSKLKRLAASEATGQGARQLALQQQVDTLTVQLDLDDPEVRWRARHGDYDLSRPVYRFLAEEAWRGKPLAMLMQRVEQMHVTPDLIPLISPGVQVDILMTDRVTGREIRPEPGAFVGSRQASGRPSILIQSFKAHERKLAMAIVDADVPDVANDSFTTRLHYLQTGITVGPTKQTVGPEDGVVLQDWVPPHPEKGTPYHRLCVLVWELPDTPPQPNAPLASQVPGAISRVGFHPQHYAQQNGLHAVGVHFWRQEWDAELAEVMAGYPEAGFTDRKYRRIKA
ncbi:phosphatidylethanolamine-binding protein [Protomyces lactucae-debilis]|uniref:Phosphatidylethanolamine-binding protein n=1 Tax=Protomyces lactucae-debilis TaxID=2754530 RepID=A0A1Y2FBJ6_PROLT|nr:phosphatidylethanolamine-binding protein [Protomyces lactucae-debilis]ORY80987.1 phosphatidylethanolamine-binding protein [Protomyces lactucae-debilis]